MGLIMQKAAIQKALRIDCEREPSRIKTAIRE